MEVIDVTGRHVGIVVEAGVEAFVLGTSRGDLRVSIEAVFTVEAQVSLLCNADCLGRYLAFER